MLSLPVLFPPAPMIGVGPALGAIGTVNWYLHLCLFCCDHRQTGAPRCCGPKNGRCERIGKLQTLPRSRSQPKLDYCAIVMLEYASHAVCVWVFFFFSNQKQNFSDFRRCCQIQGLAVEIPVYPSQLGFCWTPHICGMDLKRLLPGFVTIVASWIVAGSAVWGTFSVVKDVISATACLGWWWWILIYI